MEEIYVVKLKTRPGTSTLYPSERRYSASTVGGLGLVHLLLCATLLVLATLGMASEEADARGRYAGAVALGLAAGVAAGVALLAWRRWYVDNNIRHFLVASTVAGIVALVCLCLTSVALASVQEEISTRYLFSRLVISTPPNATAPATPEFDVDPSAFNPSVSKFDTDLSTPSSRRGVGGNDTADAFAEDGDEEVPTGEALNETSVRLEARGRGQWIYNYESFQEIRNVVLINVLVASVLELAWCLLSMRIAWRGVNNVYSDSDERPSKAAAPRKNKFLPDERRLRSPDIIHNLAVNVVSREVDQYLPKGESTVEYEDRVRRFLACDDAVDGTGKH